MKNQVINEFKEWLKSQKFNNTIYEKTAGAYIRVSTDKQDEYSPISQLKAIWEYCERNNMYLNIDYIFIEDEGISGKNALKRTEFQNMIATAKADKKPFDTIVLWKFSRFARNQEESIVYKSLLRKKHNINIISVSEPLPTGPFGGLIERIIEWFDEYYLVNLSGEVKRGMTEKALKGGLQSTPAFGYDVDKQNNILVVNESESQIVKFIYEEFTIKNKSMLDIAKQLYKMNIKTKRGSRFEPRTIYYILANPVYIGKLRWTPTGKTKWDFNNDESIIVNGKHEAIISNELFERTQNILKTRIRKPYQRIDSEVNYWLRGIIRCKECGHTLIKHNRKKLRCNGYNHGQCSNQTTLVMSEVENLVIQQIKKDFSTGIISNIVEKSKAEKKVDTKSIILNQIKMNELKLNRAKEAYQSGVDSLEEYKENKIKIEKEQQYLKSQLNEISNNNENNLDDHKKEIIENGKKVYEILLNENISTKEKNDILHQLINKIEFNENTYELTIFYN